MAAFIAKQMIGSQLNSVKGKTYKNLKNKFIKKKIK